MKTYVDCLTVPSRKKYFSKFYYPEIITNFAEVIFLILYKMKKQKKKNVLTNSFCLETFEFFFLC